MMISTFKCYTGTSNVCEWYNRGDIDVLLTRCPHTSQFDTSSELPLQTTWIFVFKTWSDIVYNLPNMFFPCMDAIFFKA